MIPAVEALGLLAGDDPLRSHHSTLIWLRRLLVKTKSAPGGPGLERRPASMVVVRGSGAK